MTDGAFDAAVAARYDHDVRDRFDPDEIARTVEVLADLAAGRPVLEFASGTGRLTLPLATRGLDVHGLELSRAMVAEMTKKPGGSQIPVTIGDMATTRVPGSFGLVLLAFNTITNLVTQADQVACFQNAAAHLEPGGRFVVETLVPPLRRLASGERFLPFDVSGDHVGVDEYDIAEQRLTSRHYWIGDGEARTFTSPHRYGWPAEYDLMAQLAGMTLSARWSDWSMEEFTAESTSHVSVWRVPT